MNERGYGVDWQDSHKYITYTDLAREQAGEKACKIRDNKLEKYYNMGFGKESMEPVSYTHLDVYKRQAWSMSLREMHEQQKQSNPREQLQELNRYSVLKQLVAVLQQLYALLQLADELPVLLCVSLPVLLCPYLFLI